MGSSSNLDTRARRALWVSMAAIYGQPWLDSYGDSEGTGARAWSRGLAGLTAQQVAAGVDACAVSADPSPPTLPEFRARCLGVLSLAEVENELRGTTPRSYFTCLVLQLLDRDAHQRAKPTRRAQLLRHAYDQARSHCMRAPRALAQQAPAIAHEKPARWVAPTPDHRAATLASVRSEIGFQHHPTNP